MRRFSDFKQQAVEPSQLGVTKRQIAEELGIGAKLLGRWCEEFSEHVIRRARQGAGRGSCVTSRVGPRQEGAGLFKKNGSVVREGVEVK